MGLYSLVISLLSFGFINAYPTGVDTCISTPNHGNWASGCSDVQCISPFTIEVLNNGRQVHSYIPYTNYSLILTTRTSSFKGFLMNVGVGTLNANFADVSLLTNNAGFIRLDPTDTNVRKMTSCTNGITHIQNGVKTQVKSIWTSPSSVGTGNVTFKAVITVASPGSNYVTSLILPEAVTTMTISATPKFTTTFTTTPTVTKIQSLSLTLTSSRSSSHSASLTLAPSPSHSPSLTLASSPSLSPSPSPSHSPSPSPSSSLTLAYSPSPSSSFTPSLTPSFTPPLTPSPPLTQTLSMSKTYNGSVYLRTTSTGGVSETVGLIITVCILGIVSIGATIAYCLGIHNVSPNIMKSVQHVKEVQDYKTENPVTVPVTLSRVSLKRKEFPPMHSSFV